MPGKTVTLATFHDLLAAEVMRNHLEAHGVPAVLSGGTTATAFAGLSNISGGIQLLVAEENLKEAVLLLAEHEENRQGGDPDEELPGAWTCSACGTRMYADEAVCTRCGTEAGALTAAPLTHALTADPAAVRDYEKESGERDEDEEPATLTADDLARRALMAALFGCVLCPPLLHLYSLWQLLKLSAYEELSRKGVYQAVAAFLLDTVVIGIFTLLLLQWSR